MKKAIESKKAPQAIGPYNQAIECNGIVFVSGQLPVNTETGIPKTIAEQTNQVLINLGYVLEEAGLTYNDVVKTTCFLSNMDDFSEMNSVYGTFFKDVPPARATVAVRTLPLNVLVEIECIAMKQE